MGAGEGGYHSSLKIIPYIPKNIPCAIVFIQEMRTELIEVFSNYLNDYSRMDVKQIQTDEILMEGTCYVTNHLAPIKISRTENGTFRISKEKTMDNPSNVLSNAFSMLAKECGSHAIAVALTGRDTNVVEGLKDIKKYGGTIIVQQPDTCLKPETAILAIQEKVTEKIIPDIDIPSVLWHILKNKVLSALTVEKKRTLPLIYTKKFTQPMSILPPESKLLEQKIPLESKLPSESKKYSILLMDEDEQVHQFFMQVLPKYTITFVRDGVEAIFYLGKEKFDLIISNISMPNLDGLKFLQMKNQKGITTPLLFLVRNKEEMQRFSSFQIESIEKPLKAKEVFLKIKHMLL
jgi:chemotaxis response regulator CheB